MGSQNFYRTTAIFLNDNNNSHYAKRMNYLCVMVNVRTNINKLLLLIAVAFLLTSCASRRLPHTSSPSGKGGQTYYINQDGYRSNYPPVTNWMDELISFSKQFIGKPYGYRCSKDLYFDCSGYICYLFNSYGVSLPRSSSDIYNYVNNIVTPLPGDLAFFTGSNKNNRRVGHVALIISIDERGIRMIHSTSSRGVMIDTLDKNRYYQERFLKYGRIPGLRNR